ncbi:unnamed protein product, partial [Oppiella nova]
MDDHIIYESSEAVVKVQKKRLKAYKDVIKQNTCRSQRFPVVRIDRFPKLDKYCTHVQTNGFSQSIDHKINRLCRQLSNETNGDGLSDSSDRKTNNQKKRSHEEMIDLCVIQEENDELDFEEESLSKKFLKTNEYKRKSSSADTRNDVKNESKYTKLNDFEITSEAPKKSYNYIPSQRSSEMKGMSVYSDNNLNTDTKFKIPKRDSQNIETIVERTQTLKNSRRWVDAFDQLSRNLSDDQWDREDVIELLVQIAKGMAAGNDFCSTKINHHFNALTDKLKTLKYIEDEFWDQIIYMASKKNESKTNSQINALLSGLYDYLLDNKISARLVCTEAVVVAYRVHTKHATAKDLLDLQATPTTISCVMPSVAPYDGVNDECNGWRVSYASAPQVALLWVALGAE